MNYLKLIFVFILGSYYANAIAQNYYFPDSDAMWSICADKYFVEGDSTLNDIEYKKYYRCAQLDTSFYALLREDTLTREIFYVKPDETQEYLLYDFSLEVGDTISVYPIYYYNSFQIEVTGIDSILIGDNYRRKLLIGDTSSYYSEFWIEGMGSTAGLFQAGTTGDPFGYFSNLLCYVEGNEVMYEYNSNIGCFTTCGTAVENIANKINLSFFPNPAQDHLSFSSDEIIQHIVILDINGQQLYAKAANQTNGEIEVSHLTEGIYLVLVKTELGIGIEKIIKG